MKFIMTIFMLTASVMVFHVQAVTISGVVKTIEGSGIEGAIVRLGKTDIATMTDPDGSFTLKDNTAVVRDQTDRTASGSDRPFIFGHLRLFFNVAEKVQVKVSVYDCNGRLLLEHDMVTSTADRAIAFPHFPAGIHIYNVQVNGKPYAFRCVDATDDGYKAAPSLRTTVPARQAMSAAVIDDALLFIKEGYQLYRLAIRNSDTSGIQATMAPIVTGSMTDADGNVYRTVRIGNQEWTAENLRTTKYNDNSGIPKANYSFYNNTTDAAAKKKWGALYNWAAVSTGKLAPAGWHVSTDADWDTLQNYLITHGYNYDGTTSENKIAKSLGAKTDWQTFSEIGAIGNDLSINNASGFSALPAGCHYYTGEFMNQNELGYWWTATKHDALYSWYRLLYYTNFDLYRSDRVTSNGFSVRLVRNN